MMLGFLLIATLFVTTGNAYNILILYPTPSYSHQIPIMALTEALVKRGHQLFVVSPNAVPGLKQNYSHVDLSFSYDFLTKDANATDDINLQQYISRWEKPKMYKPYSRIPGRQFNSTQFLQFSERVEAEQIKFDVALIESFAVPFLCGMTRFLGGYTIPMISMTTTSHEYFVEDEIGSIKHLSYTPANMNDYTDKMSVWQRIDNWFSALYINSRLKEILEDAARNWFKESYGPNFQTLVDGCWSNVSLSMMSSNFLYYYPRLLGLNVIELGPLHPKKPGKLPRDIQDWLDGAEKVVIYFSLGSNFKSISLPEIVRSHFLKVFRELPSGYRVLWKWELDGGIPGQSKNILARKWTPQQDVLAHPKVKVFITQGGLQSFQESVHHGVPMVGIPRFGDQELNVAKMVDAGIGTRLRPDEMYSFEKIKAAVEAVLYDESYTRNMAKLSATSKELTSQALDKGVFWVEHVAKFGGAAHLRPSTSDATLFEFLCLDLITAFLVIAFTTILIFRYAFSFFAAKIKQS